MRLSKLHEKYAIITNISILLLHNSMIFGMILLNPVRSIILYKITL